MAEGDVWAAFVWSGDMVQLHADNKYLRFVIPKSGGGIWTDNMLIPKHGNAYLASVYMNFVYDPRSRRRSTTTSTTSARSSGAARCC
jgi:spermidine/putrescine transport system substrate-binding protein